MDAVLSKKTIITAVITTACVVLGVWLYNKYINK